MHFLDFSYFDSSFIETFSGWPYWKIGIETGIGNNHYRNDLHIYASKCLNYLDIMNSIIAVVLSSKVYNCCNKAQRWRHQMETFSALLALCAGNSPVTGEFPAQRPVTRSFNVFFVLRLNKRLSKQSRGWWCRTPSRPLWRHCNGNMAFIWSMHRNKTRYYLFGTWTFM